MENYPTMMHASGAAAAAAAAASAFAAFADDISSHSTSEEQNLHDDAVSSPTGSSESSKDKWQPKRHVCEIPDCGKSFDSKWALIRFVNGGTDEWIYLLMWRCMRP